jgi:hypothetical protein
MIGRILCTLVLILLSGGAFLGAATTPASPLNLFGILFLTVSGIVWLTWDEFREGLACGVGETDGPRLPLLVRFGPVFLTGMVNKSEPPPALKPRSGESGRRRSDR